MIFIPDPVYYSGECNVCGAKREQPHATYCAEERFVFSDIALIRHLNQLYNAIDDGHAARRAYWEKCVEQRERQLRKQYAQEARRAG